MAPIVHEGELSAPDVQALIAAHVESMRASSPPDACHVLPGSALDHPSITFFTAREGADLLGMAALKELSPTLGEVKSMRTAPNALGRGVGQLLLSHMLAVARQRGYRALCLETGSTPEFAAALRLYERAGFQPSSPFGGYPATPFTRFMRLEL